MANKKDRRARMRRRRARKRSLQFETLETRQLLAADGMHNMIRPADINNDGQVNTIDALMAVDRVRSGRAPQPGDGFFDVNGDGRFNIADPLSAIDSLRRARRGPREPVETEARTITGEGNNEVNTEWGQAGQAYLRLVEPDYADGLSEPSGADRPSAREVSNIVLSQDGLTQNERGLSDLFWQWGQFLDHDLDLTEHDDEDEFNIEVPAGDAWFDPLNTGEVEISLSRSIYDSATGLENARQQLNSITAFIDGSNIYGSDEEVAAELRTFAGGRLATSDGGLLPVDEAGFFQAGDVRANEQAGLTAMHTIWVREHNRIADRIAAENPGLTDEEIYQRARTMVVAELQAITYNEFLPALLGRDALQRYDGYDENVNPGISNLFATAAYRFGHTMLSPELLRLDENGEVAEEGSLSLRDAFFSPDELSEHGVDSILRGMASNTAQEIDAQLIDDVRNFLFGPPGAGGFDLASLNIQRGRDHGLPDYNAVREQLGLGRVESFADITSDAETQAALEEAYGDVDSIDVWVGMLAEDHAAGAAIGETAATVLIDQFERLRDGDRFWYQRVLSGEQLRQAERTTLADVIERNTGVEDLQRNVFFAPDSQPERPLEPPNGGKGPPPPPGPGGEQGPGRRGPDNGPGGDENRRGEQRERGGPGREAPTALAGKDALLDDLLLPPLDPLDVDSIFEEGDV